MTTAIVEYVDYVCGEYGLFGKVVARSDVRGFTEDEVAGEIVAMKAVLGEHVDDRVVEEVAAA